MSQNPIKPLIDVQNLSVAFGDRQVIENIRFTIEPGEIVALVGESGSGKSVTALSLLRLLPYPIAHHPKGTILLEGRDILQATPKELRAIRGNRIAMIFQEPMTSLNPLHRVGQQIAESVTEHRYLSKSDAQDRIIELLHLVGLDNAESKIHSYPHELSGGQRQRVMIAMALANDPDLLIADEPTTALDVTIQAQILKLLKELQQKRGMAMLLISHDLGIVKKMADKVVIMQNGTIVEQGPVDTIFAEPKHKYTRLLMQAIPSPKSLTARTKTSALMSCEELRVWFPIKRGLLRRIDGYVKAVDSVTIEIEKGKTLGIVGESGSGKTTLGLALLRLIESKGKILFQNQEIDSLSRQEMRPLRRFMQIVFQDPYESLSPRLSVGEIVAEGLEIHGTDEDKRLLDSRVIDALLEVGLDPETRHRYPHEFSGGQRQRIALARALILKPSLVVLDEPTSALDMLMQTQMIELLLSLQQRHGLTYLFISHDLRVIRALSDHIIVMRNGKIVEQGNATDVFEKPKSDYTRALLAASLYHEVAYIEELRQ